MQPIGSFINEQPFVNHGIQLEKGDAVYMFTDGFIDQFNGQDGSKYSTKRFKELLIKSSNNSMNKQKEILENELQEWMQNSKQIDDILILGFKI